MDILILQYCSQYNLYNPSATSGFLLKEDGVDNRLLFTIPTGIETANS